VESQETLEKINDLKDAIMMGELVLKLGKVAKKSLKLQGRVDEEVKKMKDKTDRLLEAEIKEGRLSEESRQEIYQHFGKIIKLLVSKNGEKNYQQATQVIKAMMVGHKKELGELGENL
jgi:putative heme iron utilization protein